MRLECEARSLLLLLLAAFLEVAKAILELDRHDTMPIQFARLMKLALLIAPVLIKGEDSELGCEA